ncbi:helix-turn-helix domain-containing protein [Pseudoduganella sp. RAF19]|uniref:helix-turn-helix domain-containing protein n=1 Tax=Pseudoduganella sp. RAF19 TaxID=3233052 RepID=UPI003F98FB34
MSETGVPMEEWQEEPKHQRHASTPGAELKAAREAMGLSVEQISDQLKLAQRQVIAIENADYDALPNMAVTRGFIRAYAKAVRLDPAPLVAMVEVEGAAGHATATVRPTKVTASFSESRFPTLTERQSKPVGAIVAGIGVVALIAVAGAWKAGYISPATFGAKNPAVVTETPAPETTTAAPVAAQPADQAPLQSPSVPLISVPPPAGSASNAPAVVPGAGVNPAPAAPATAPGATTAAPAGVTAPAPASAQPAQATPAATAAGAAAPAGKPAAPAPAPASAAAQPVAQAPVAAMPAPAAAVPAAAPAAGGGKLVLKVNEDSWIEIRRPGSNSLIARLVKAGDTQSFDVRAKDLIIVGKPSGVQATLQGAPLDLPQVPGGTISRVNIK